ncbi:MAG TPA: PP2C family protein-serine/threonine phosphatase [Bryobacteraceae bacterium]
MSEYAGEVYRLACLELRGGNQCAVYSADLPGLAAWVSCRPLGTARAGGDLYYLSVCSHGVVSRVTLADVAGHGEGVSSVAERLRDGLREHADEWDQSALIRQLNETMLKGARGVQFATAVLLSYYAEAGDLLFTNAGHVPPLWYRANKREWSFMQDLTPYSKEIADLPLGMIPGTSYTQTAVHLDPQDLVLLYTDGVNESHDEAGEQLGLHRLLSIARTLPVGSARETGQALLNEVARYRGSVPRADDETLVALQRRPA